MLIRVNPGARNYRVVHLIKRENYSLLIKGGRLIDPAAKIDAAMDVLLRDGRWPRSRRPAKPAAPRMKNSMPAG